jgi:hypothetical protein
MLARLRRYAADRRYIEEHRTELAERYPDRWIAVLNGCVVESAPTLEELAELLRDYPRPAKQPAIDFTGPDNAELIL